MKTLLYATTALVTVGFLMAGCEQAPAGASSGNEEPIKLELGGYLNKSFTVGKSSDDDEAE